MTQNSKSITGFVHSNLLFYNMRVSELYMPFIAKYDSGCQICCNLSKLKPGFKVLAHQSTMP